LDWKTQFLESYNKALESGIDIYMKKRGNEAANGLEEDAYEEYTEAAKKLWNDMPQDILEGKSPDEFLNGIDSLSQVLELFTEACVICDDGVPEILEKKLESFGNEAEERLIELAAGGLDSDQDEASIIATMSVRLLGRWRVCRLVPRLVEILMRCKPNDLMLMEEIETALINIGNTDVLLDAMSAVDTWTLPHEYLASALAKAGKRNKKDQIYRSLKEYFLKSGKIVSGASNLAEYGDGRAIPALRGYAERNISTLDRQAFFEIKSAVERLGGSMEDLTAQYIRIAR